jgi:single-stranded-DNA-specific exonuclease
MPSFSIRPVDEDLVSQMAATGVPQLLARVLAARGVPLEGLEEPSLDRLLPWSLLKGIEAATQRLADAVQQSQKIVIIADYDADGATACAVGLRALRAMGGQADYFVPNRLTLGYGLTPEVVELARAKQPDLLVTVDNGIASIAGVDAANVLGIPVIITDHHLPGSELPRAAAIVNPNQPGCPFPSKNLAGVGVMFYVMMALRAELRRRGAFNGRDEPHLGRLLDLVALGTVADVVRLDANNRLLVGEGLKRIARGHGCAGIEALYRVAGRDPHSATSADMGFILGPRLNAAGRMEDMTWGIECLVTEDRSLALRYAQRLDALNRERREVEGVMQDAALARLNAIDAANRYTLSLYDPEWHPGVVGILASRLKDQFHRPAIVFAQGTTPGEIRGSGRSIAGFHLRDALDWITKQHPDLILRFGGHSAAAGLTLRSGDLERFRDAFETAGRQWLTPEDLEQDVEYDGEAEAHELDLPLAQALSRQVWGQGFPEPLFGGRFLVLQQRVLKDRHLKLRLSSDGVAFDAIFFGQSELLPDRIYGYFRLGINEWNGNRQVQLELRHWRV